MQPQKTGKKVDVVGVDLGIKALANLSTGEVFEAVSAYRKAEKQLASLQDRDRKKVKFYHNWKKVQLKTAKLDLRIS